VNSTRFAANFDSFAASRTWNAHQERALSLLLSSSTTEAFDVAREPQKLRERYGEQRQRHEPARRPAAGRGGRPFVTVFWRGESRSSSNKKCASGGGWDTHGNNFNCLKEDLLPEFRSRILGTDRRPWRTAACSDQTLLLVTSEMGRKPKIGDPRSGGASERAATTGHTA
jgi:hypothetical protein